MGLSRRDFVAGTALAFGGAARVNAAPLAGRRALPADFLWATAISAQDFFSNAELDHFAAFCGKAARHLGAIAKANRI
jgi:hypothetical protein